MKNYSGDGWIVMLFLLQYDKLMRLRIQWLHEIREGVTIRMETPQNFRNLEEGIGYNWGWANFINISRNEVISAGFRLYLNFSYW